MNSQKSKGKALITGASSGIGAVYADRLAKRGYDLILVARDVVKLNELSNKISTETNRKVEVLKADLTQKNDLLKVEAILKSDEAITLLVNNAGIATATPFIDSDVDLLEHMITLNVTALTRLSSAIAVPFVKRQAGTIINIASAVALVPGLVSGTYSATKAYVLNLTQALNNELSDKGIQIQAVLPGATRTNIWGNAGVDINTFPQEIVMSTEDMVDASLVGLDQKELITIPALPQVEDWNAFEAARLVLSPNLSRVKPANRYLK